MRSPLNKKEKWSNIILIENAIRAGIPFALKKKSRFQAIQGILQNVYVQEKLKL